jgi:hypothetical protein
MSVPRTQPKPWPMKWIVLVIVLSLGTYTWLTLHYRKANPAFAPYGDMKDRANTTRLLASGYQRISLRVERPADPLPVANGATIIASAGGLSEDLRLTLIDQPLLPQDYHQVSAAPSTNGFFPYLIRFACTVTDPQWQPGPVHLYVREDQITIVPELEKLSGDLLTRRADNIVLLTVPGGTLKPGTYTIVLAGQRESRTWTLQVH